MVIFLLREDSVNVAPMVNINKKHCITFYFNPNSVISYSVKLFISDKLFKLAYLSKDLF